MKLPTVRGLKRVLSVTYILQLSYLCKTNKFVKDTFRLRHGVSLGL